MVAIHRDLAPHAFSDGLQFTLLIIGSLVDGADAKVDRGAAHSCLPL